LVEAIRGNETIRLPDFDPVFSRPATHFALTSVGIEPNVFGSVVGRYRYQFEGEEDLLHLIVVRQDDQAISVEEAQEVVGWVLRGVPAALVWLKPGQYSQHFYVGHDELLDQLLVE
jgi:hypothetical protein